MSNFEDINYIPVLAVRPSEMNALKELPERDKDLLLPAIQLRPWTTANYFENTIAKVKEAFGENRQWIANLDGQYESPESNGERALRPVLQEFSDLRNPENGYSNWCAFTALCSKHTYFIGGVI